LVVAPVPRESVVLLSHGERAPARVSPTCAGASFILLGMSYQVLLMWLGYFALCAGLVVFVRWGMPEDDPSEYAADLDPRVPPRIKGTKAHAYKLTRPRCRCCGRRLRRW
jgi:hypothetical protein